MLALPACIGTLCMKYRSISTAYAKEVRHSTCSSYESAIEAAEETVRGSTMLRVKMHESVDVLTFRLEGRLTGEGAEHVRTLVTRCDPEMRLVIDLTDVMFIDGVGEEVLALVKRLGAEFIAETSYALHVCERLLLPLVSSDGSDIQALDGSNGNGSLARY
jgi:hypothetical protein